MNTDSEEKNVFIASDDFAIAENDKFQFFKYYDPLNNQYLTFISNPSSGDKALYIAIKQDHFKSAFMGNLVLPAPTLLFVKKFNPLLLIIGLISLAIHKGHQEEMDYATILAVYSEEVKKGKKINETECINFVRKVLYANAAQLDLICEVKRNDVFEDHLSCKFKLLKSKVYDFLNSKINLNRDALTNLASANESEREEIERKMIRERFDVLLQFMPKELMLEYAADKNIKVNKGRIIQEEKKEAKIVQKTLTQSLEAKNSDSSEAKKVSQSLTNLFSSTAGLKRKAPLEDISASAKNAPKKKKANKKQAPDVNIDQANLSSFFTKK